MVKDGSLRAGSMRRQPFISDYFNRSPSTSQTSASSSSKVLKKDHVVQEEQNAILQTRASKRTPSSNSSPNGGLTPASLKTATEKGGGSPLLSPSLAEAQAKRSNQREVLKLYPPLTLVWAKFSKYPSWPALVAADPVSQMTYDNEEDSLHVLFLDEPPTWAWVPLDKVEIMKASSLTEESAEKKPKGRWAKALAFAKKKAARILKQSVTQRRKFLMSLEKTLNDGHAPEDSTFDGGKSSESDEERENQSPKVTKKRKRNTPKGDVKVKRSKTEPTPDASRSEPIQSSSGETNGLSEYELIRLKNIEARQKMFAELEISQSKQSLSDSFSQGKSYNASQRGLAAKKDKVEDLPRRQSLRLQKIDADTGLQLPDKEPTVYVLPDEHPRQALATLGLSELITDPTENGTQLKTSQSFLESLAETLTKPVGNNDFSLGADFKSTTAALSKLQIKTDQVAKVVPDRIFSLDIHPTEDKLLVAVGGKWGGLGLWDVKDVDSASNGVLLFMPHSRPVNCLSFDNYQSNRLISTSYDGTVRMLDVQQQRVDLLFGDEDDTVYTCYHRQIDASTFVVALGNSGDVGIIDEREDNRKFSSRFSVAKSGSVKTVDIHPCQPEKLLTTTSRGDCQIFDIRSPKKQSHGVLSTWLDLSGHKKALSSAFFSPVKGSSIVTVCYDNKLRLYKSWGSSDSITPYSSIDHNNQTGRWLTTFKARWHPRRDDLFFVGSMSHPRQINAYSDQGFQYPSLMGEDLGSICSIVVCHPSQDIVVGGNSSGRVHVFM